MTAAKTGNQVLSFVWGGMVAFVLAHVGIAILLRLGKDSLTVDGKGILIAGVVILAGVSIGGIRWVRRNVQTRFAVQVITWGLAQSVSVYGLVLGMLGFPPQVWVPFCGMAFFLLIRFRPRNTPEVQ